MRNKVILDHLLMIEGQLAKQSAEMLALKEHVNRLEDMRVEKALAETRDKQPDPEEWVPVRLVFKANYLTMFTRKGWLCPHAIKHLYRTPNWNGLICAANVQRKYISHLDLYCSTKVMPQ